MKNTKVIIIEKCSYEKYKTVVNILCNKYGFLMKTSNTPLAEAINIGSVHFAKKHEASKDILESSKLRKGWDLIFQTDERGFIITGENEGRAIHALLTVIDWIKYEKNLIHPFRSVRAPIFNRLYQNFDDMSFGFSRAADGFDLERHVFDVARIGFENFEINRLYDDIPIQIRERENHRDNYPWWNSYMPALDMFYESSLNKGTYSDKMLADNRSVLLKSAELARKMGLKPIYTTFEPRAWPERLFNKYPELRGARVDWDAYSCMPEYAPDINHPLVKQHYAQLMEQLMKDVPDLDLFEIWSQDSAAGFPWADFLYQKPNGPTRLYGLPLYKSVNNLLTTLRDVGLKYNPDINININIDWVFSQQEQSDIINNLPENTGVTFDYSKSPNNEVKFFDIIKKDNSNNYQVIKEGIGNAWKIYGPLLGFPFPRGTYHVMLEMYEKGIRNVSARGGITSEAYVPYYINSEVIRACKFEVGSMDIEKFLYDTALLWTGDKKQADILNKAWAFCDEFNQVYDRCGIHWTTAMFVSSRTLFRKLIRPIVPDHSVLTYEEKRYYAPNVFFTAETDPSWDDISYFNFCQMTSDKLLGDAARHIETKLIPLLEKCIGVLESGGKNAALPILDLKSRVKCLYYIMKNERDLLDTQLRIHEYLNGNDTKNRIRTNILSDIKTTEDFVKLLKETKAVLIPVTSGEETPYMFKAPLSHLLEKKIEVMEKHLNDIPGPAVSKII